MTDYSGNLPPAGWYPDPYGEPYERWWDGAQWTDHTNVPAAPEPVIAPPVESQPVAPAATVTTEPPYRAPVEQPFQQPAEQPVQQTAEQTAEQSYKTPAEPQSAWNAPASSSGASFDDIFATGQAASTQPSAAPFDAAPFAAAQTAQPAFTEPASTQEPPTAYGQPEPQAYQTAQPSYDPYAAQQSQPQQVEPQVPQQSYESQSYPSQSYPTPTGNADAAFGQLISGGGAGGASDSGDPFTSWSNQDYEEPPRNTLANVGLTFGVLSFILPGIAGLVGLVTSALGLRRAAGFKRDEGVAIGQGKSIAGIALSVLGTVASIAIVLLVLPGIINPTGAAIDDSSAVVANAPKTDFGNIAMEVGSTGTILFAGTTKPSIQFTITNITPNPKCTEDPELVLSPENGQFVALTMEFTTAADYATAMDSGGLLQVSMSDFSGYLPDDTTVVNSDSGLSCVPEAEQLPSEIPAGTTVSGTVILDLSEATTAFSYSPSGVTGLDPKAVRWEWAIAR